MNHACKDFMVVWLLVQFKFDLKKCTYIVQPVSGVQMVRTAQRQVVGKKDNEAVGLERSLFLSFALSPPLFIFRHSLLSERLKQA